LLFAFCFLLFTFGFGRWAFVFRGLGSDVSFFGTSSWRRGSNSSARISAAIATAIVGDYERSRSLLAESEAAD
jgi:hypothetical protein